MSSFIILHQNSLEVESESLVLYKPLGSYGVYFDNAVAAYQKSYPDVNVQVREFGTNTTDPNVFQQNYHDLKDTLTSEFIIKINHIYSFTFCGSHEILGSNISSFSI